MEAFQKGMISAIYHTQTHPSEHDIIATLITGSISQDIRTADTASDWLIGSLGTAITAIFLLFLNAVETVSSIAKCMYTCILDNW